MKTFQRVLLLLALLTGCSQLLWFCHHKWVMPRTSVLDKYQEKVDEEIRDARSLGELESQCRAADQAVKAYEANPASPRVEPAERRETEPYKTREALESAIQYWEAKDAKVRETRFFWGAGLLFAALGTLVFRRWSPWLGVSFLVVGFTEMFYWCGPGSVFEGAEYQFDRMLANNLFLCLVTLLLLGAVAAATRTLEGDRP